MDSASWRTSFAGLAGSHLAVYDEVMVPRMFDPWARLLMEMVEVKAGEAVLDIACGPGTVARVAAERAGPTGRVVGCDLSPGMLERARAKGPVDGGAPLEYREGPADALPAADAEFDVVTCQHGVQFFPDRPGAVREMRRVLRPGGLSGVAVWRAIEHLPPLAALGAGVEEVAGRELADRYRGGPFGFGEPDALGKLFEDAGFTEVTVTERVLPIRFEGGPAQVVSTLAPTPIAEGIDQLSAEQKAALVAAVARRTGDGPIDSYLTANVAVAC